MTYVNLDCYSDYINSGVDSGDFASSKGKKSILV